MAKRKYTYGKGSSEWEKPGDYYVDGTWICYYTDTGSGHSGKFTVKKALRLSDDFKANPDEAIRVMIAGDQAKRRRDAEAGEGQRPGAGSVHTDGHSELFTRAWTVVVSERLS